MSSLNLHSWEPSQNQTTWNFTSRARSQKKTKWCCPSTTCGSPLKKRRTSHERTRQKSPKSPKRRLKRWARSPRGWSVASWANPRLNLRIKTTIFTPRKTSTNSARASTTMAPRRVSSRSEAIAITITCLLTASTKCKQGACVSLLVSPWTSRIRYCPWNRTFWNMASRRSTEEAHRRCRASISSLTASMVAMCDPLVQLTKFKSTILLSYFLNPSLKLLKFIYQTIYEALYTVW